MKYIIYDGMKFTLEKGYYRSTAGISNGKRIPLHRYIYIKQFGQIPDNFDVHHIDGNKLNNDISNLKAMHEIEHRQLHNIIDGITNQVISRNKDKDFIAKHTITMRKLREERIIKQCLFCGKSFSVCKMNSTRSFYCSRGCKYRYDKQHNK